MAEDIYTTLPIATRSEEHIVPRFLGGRLTSKSLLDKTTNERLGHGIDADLERAVRAVRVILGAPNSDGEAPTALTGVAGDDGKRYRVESGGKVKPSPRGRVIEVSERELRIEATVSDAGELRQRLRKRFAGKEAQLSAVIDKAMSEGTHQAVTPPRMTFELPLWEVEPYRATAKIAFNLLAYVDPVFALDSAFDGIRKFVLDGTSLPVPPVQAAPPPSGPRLGDFDHFVHVELQPTGEVVALVSYFGHVGFVVRLGSAPHKAPRATAYRVDQLGRRVRHDAAEDLAIPVPSFQEAADRSYEDFYSLAIGQASALGDLQ